MSKAFGNHPFHRSTLGNIASRFYQGINTVADSLGYTNTGFPIIQAKHITANYLNLEDVKFVTPEDYESYKNKYQPKKGDILLSNIGTIGKSCLIKKEVDFLIAWNVFLISVNHDCVPAYINYLLEKLDQCNFYDDLVTGNATKFINKTTLGAIEIPLPSIPEQQKIAAILTAVDDVIESTQAQINKLKDLKTGMMQELLTKGIGRGGHPHTEFKDSPVGRIPKEWEVVLGDQVMKLGGGSQSDIQLSDVGDTLLMKVDDFNRDENEDGIVNSNLRFNSIENKKINTFPVGTIVIAKRGAAISKNRVQLLKNVATIDSNLMAITSLDGYSNVFLQYVLEYLKLETIADTTSIPQLNNFHLYEMKIIKPPLHEQFLIVKHLEQIKNTVNYKKKVLARLIAIKKALMQDLLTGNVRVKIN